MTAFLALLPTLLNIIPSVIAFIELLHGNTPGQGPAKAAAAVDLIQRLVPEVAPHLTSDPAKITMIQDIIALGVKIMNATGTMPVAPAPAVATAVADAG